METTYCGMYSVLLTNDDKRKTTTTKGANDYYSVHEVRFFVSKVQNVSYFSMLAKVFPGGSVVKILPARGHRGHRFNPLDEEVPFEKMATHSSILA